MTVLDERIHLVYLLTRKSDQAQYVGITIEDRLSNRLSQHRSSPRFKNDDFVCEILERSTDRLYIQKRESFWISQYNTFNEGLNKTSHGAGHGHNNGFTTLGYKFSKDSREKMSIAAKNRCTPEWKRSASTQSSNLWLNEEYRNKQSGKRIGKRLRPPKLTDEQVADIRSEWKHNESLWKSKADVYNIENKRYGTTAKLPHRLYAEYAAIKYNVTPNLISDIVKNKCRTKILPSIYKS